MALSLPPWLHPSFPCDFHNPARCHVSGADPGCLGGTRGWPGRGVGAALPVLQLLVEEEPLRLAKGSPSRYARRGQDGGGGLSCCTELGLENLPLRPLPCKKTGGLVHGEVISDWVQ